MHDELCRKCGGMLTNWSLCSECRKPIKRVCLECGLHTEERIHNVCLYHLGPIDVNPLSTPFNPPAVGRRGMLQRNGDESKSLLSEVA